MSNSLNSTNDFLWTLDGMCDRPLDSLSPAHVSCLKYLQLSSYDAVLEHAEQIIRQESEKPDGHVLKARALYLMGQYVEAEETHLKVMKIAEQNQLIDNNIEAFVKLKYELAAIRKKILIDLGVNNFRDVLKRHLLNFNSSIVELYSNTESSTHSSPKSSSNPKPVESEDVVDLKPEVSELVHNSESDGNSDLEERYDSDSQSDGDSYRTPQYTNDLCAEDVDQSSVKISLKEYNYLKESDKRLSEYEEKVNKLEEELKNVYFNTISITKARKMAEEEVHQLRSELDRMANTVRYVEQKEDEFENRYFFKINPMENDLNYKSKNKPKEDPQKMISIRNVVTEVKSEPQPTTNQNNIRHIFHNNKSVPKVD